MAAVAAENKKGPTKWIPPLPQGWEARYDEDHKAYFFIDHIHKKTQWDDPRFQSPAKQSQPQPHATPAAAVSSLGLGGATAQSHGGIPLRDLSPSQPKKERRQNDRSTIREASLTTEVDAALVNKLKAEFPNASKELITDMIILCHNNERQTREQLKDLGFLKNAPSGGLNHASPHRKTSGGAAPTKKSPDKAPQTAAAAAASAASPAKKEIPEAEKRKVLIQAKELFPKLDPHVIRIALNECHYSLEKVKELLTAWEKSSANKEHAKSANAGSGNSSVNSSASSVRAMSPPAGSLEPQKLDDDVTNKGERNPRNSQSSTQYLGKNLQPNSFPGVIQIMAKGDTVSAKSSCSQHARAKQVTKMSEHLLNTTSDLLNHLATTASCCTSGEDVGEGEDESKKVVEPGAEVADEGGKRSNQSPRASPAQPTAITSQPAVEPKQKVPSLYRTEAKGPDASLRKGPDSSLLTSDYTQANGPDKSILAGPNRSHLTSRHGAMGPDMSLRCGPQSSLLQENRNNLVSPSEALVPNF